MVTYKDLRDWIATNKGESVADLLDKNCWPFMEDSLDTSLSEMLLGCFFFAGTGEGRDFWWGIYEELKELEKSESACD